MLGVSTDRGAKTQKELRRKKTLKRIKEYERFEAHCIRLQKAAEEKRRARARMRRRNTLVEGGPVRVKVLRKTQSVSHSAGREGAKSPGLPQPGAEETVAGRLYLVSLVRLWRARARGVRPRASSLPCWGAGTPLGERRSSDPAGGGVGK
jgi:hypothetical protein